MKIFPTTLALLLVPWCVFLGCTSTKKPSGISKLRDDPPEIITMTGQFRMPGKYTWTNGMTLRDGFAVAGGLTESARRRIYITHWDETKRMYWLTVDKMLTNNPELEPGDRIRIPPPEQP